MALAFLTPLFYYIPTSALAAVIIMAVTDMIDFSMIKHLWIINSEFVSITWILLYLVMLVADSCIAYSGEKETDIDRQRDRRGERDRGTREREREGDRDRQTERQRETERNLIEEVVRHQQNIKL